MGPGFFIQQGGGNTFLNCDSHENEDTLTSNGDGQSADGFGCHPTDTGDSGNLFHGCRAWWNSDDGWDFIHANETCTVEYSWSWYEGYKPDALSGGAPVALAAGNGNGFKGGGYDIPPTNVPAVPPQHVIRLNAAFYNKEAGFYANHSPVSQFFYNNTSYHNGTDFNMLGVASDGSTSISVGILRNNLAFAGALTSNTALGGGLISDEFNSWDTSLGVTVSAADFQSVAFAPPASCPAAYAPGGTTCVTATDTTSFAGMASARQADGSLPVLPFLRLASTSDLIDKGTNVGLPYSGKAPDLGCFETGLVFDGSDGGASSGSSSSSTSSTSSTGSTGSTGATATGSSAASSSGSTSTTGSAGGSGTTTSAGTASAKGSSSAGSLASAASGASASAGGSDSRASQGSSSSEDNATGQASGCSCYVARRSDASDVGGGSLVVLTAIAAMRRRRTRGARAS